MSLTLTPDTRARLLELLPPGTTVHTILVHTSPSGMGRWIRPVLIGKDGDVLDLTYLVARALGIAPRRGRHDGIYMGGCGMDMGFALVYGIGRALYPDGAPCTGHRVTETRRNGRRVLGCQSNDHSNGDRTYRRGKLHSDGGYALRQAWL